MVESHHEELCMMAECTPAVEEFPGSLIDNEIWSPGMCDTGVQFHVNYTTDEANSISLCREECYRTSRGYCSLELKATKMQ